ncbi:MAG TPA: hypothetical protein PKK06_16485 [Phycisphaerae bacterium]|nr:hypothetical protein [Phycisphaerae bacterium]HNU45919.1 hypothetical protein [Phycisphaerae bacterium]
MVSQRWSLAEIDEAQRDTQPLIDALVAYRTDHGVYPDALSQLVPRYLKTIGRAPLGNPEWQYHPREDNQEFEIVFEEAPYGANCVYISRTGEWMCDTG